MNMFHLSVDPYMSAMFHHDKHVVKMPLESAQMLCAAVTINGGTAPYKVSHRNHPTTRWATESRRNWLDLRALGLALCDEYRFRYGRDHACLAVIMGLCWDVVPDVDGTEIPQCLPDEYKVPGNPVQAYRNYYLGEKLTGVRSTKLGPVIYNNTWTKRDVPYWIRQFNERMAA